MPMTDGHAPVPAPGAGPSADRPNDPVEQAVLRRVPFEIIMLSAILAVPAALLFNLPTALFFLGGGVLSGLSFVWMKNAVFKFMARDKAGALRSGLGLYAIRFFLLLGVFLLIILTYPKRIFAFAASLLKSSF